ERRGEWFIDRAGIDDALARHADVFGRVSAARPHDAALWVARVRQLARDGRWKEALSAAIKAVELRPDDPWGWFCLAPLCLETGADDTARRCCRELLTRWGDADTAVLAEWVAKTHLLKPDAAADLRPIVRLAERGVAGTAGDANYPWFQFTRANAYYRAGEYD